MRHLTSGGFYKQFLQVVFICALLLWTFSLFTASRDHGNRPAGLELLSFTGLSPSGGDALTAKLQQLELDYERERQERVELERGLEELLTKQQDIQGQLDILRQQIPLPEDAVEGAAKPPDIGYTKWAKNYYNTRRTDPEGPEANSGAPEHQDSVVDVRQANIEMPRLHTDTTKGTAIGTKKSSLTEGNESSEGGKCVLPRKLDYAKDFWGAAPFTGCCRAGSCNAYELRNKGRFLVSKCKEEATLAWSDGSQTIALDEMVALSSIPNVGSRQYVKFKCGTGLEELVVLPMTNDKAHKRALALNATSPSQKPNVVVMMIDAVSRAQFVRAMPKTLKLLDGLNSDPAQKFSAFDFQFFGTLGAYSPPNRYAFFSGYPFADDQAFFDGSPFPRDEKVLRVNAKEGVWMWDILRDRGYITYSARDMCSRTASFVYDDFISRPWTDVHFQDIYCHFNYRAHAASSEHCLKTRYAHQYTLDSGSLFYRTYSDVPSFTYLDFAEGHEPSMRIVRTMDNDLVAHLPGFLADENTVVVLASDHGIGYGKQHTSKDGPLEERLPGLYVIAPNRLLTTESHRNLGANTQKIVTGLDVFETIMDVAGLAGSRPWAHSLLRPMPSRNCKEAGLNIHACPCSHWDGQQTSRITWK